MKIKRLVALALSALTIMSFSACGAGQGDASGKQQNSDRLELTDELQDVIVSDKINGEFLQAGSGVYRVQLDAISAAKQKGLIEKASNLNRFTYDLDYKNASVTSYDEGDDNNILVYGKLYGLDNYGNKVIQQFDMEYYFVADETSDTGYKIKYDMLKLVDA